MSEGTLVLVIDDEIESTEILALHLQRDGYEVMTATNGTDGLRLAYDHHPDAVILDIRMPGMDGREVCARLRDFTDAAILLFSVISESSEAIRGLELGADDYITKPVEYAELRARLEASLRRRSRIVPASSPSHAPWKIDEAKREVVIEDRKAQLTPKEFEVFTVFMQNPDTVMSVDQILEQAWGSEYVGDVDLVKQFVYRLRAKLEKDPSRPRHFLTVRGAGYLFEPDPDLDTSELGQLVSGSPDEISAFRAKARQRVERLSQEQPSVESQASSSHPTPRHLPGPRQHRMYRWTQRLRDLISPRFDTWPRINSAWLILPTLLIALLSVGSLARASESALPGDSAYSLKLLVERAQMLIAPSDSRALELQIEFLQRRLDEIAALAAFGRTEDIQAAVQRLEGEVDQAIRRFPSEQRAGLPPLPEDELAAHIEALIQLRDGSASDLGPAFSDAIEATHVLRSTMLGIGHPKLGKDLITRIEADSNNDQ